MEGLRSFNSTSVHALRGATITRPIRRLIVDLSFVFTAPWIFVKYTAVTEVRCSHSRIHTVVEISDPFQANAPHSFVACFPTLTRAIDTRAVSQWCAGLRGVRTCAMLVALLEWTRVLLHSPRVSACTITEKILRSLLPFANRTFRLSWYILLRRFSRFFLPPPPLCLASIVSLYRWQGNYNFLNCNLSRFLFDYKKVDLKIVLVK